MRRAILIQAVEVEGGGLVSERIGNMNDDVVPNIGDDRGNRPFAVYSNGSPVEGTVRVGCNPADIEVIGDRGCSRNLEKGNGPAHRREEAA